MPHDAHAANAVERAVTTLLLREQGQGKVSLTTLGTQAIFLLSVFRSLLVKSVVVKPMGPESWLYLLLRKQSISRGFCPVQSRVLY